MPENRLVKKKHLQEVTKHLWDESKKKFVSEVELVQSEDANDNNKQKYKIQVTKDGVTENKNPFLVTEWQDLKHTTKRDINALNLLNYDAKMTGKRWVSSGNNHSISSENDFSMVYVDVMPNEQYTILKQVNDGIWRIYFLDENNQRLEQGNYDGSLVELDGWTKSSFRVPSGTATRNNIRKMAIQFKHGQITKEQIMVFKGDYATAPVQFTPYTGQSILIDSKEVSLSYSSDNGVLGSKTVDEAIEELSEKAVKTWDDLEYVSRQKNLNVFNKKLMMEDGKRFNYDSGNGFIESNPEWRVAKIPCQQGDEFTIIKGQANDSGHAGVFDTGDRFVEYIRSITSTIVNGRVVQRITITNANAAYVAINMYKGTNGNSQVDPNAFMVFKGNITNENLPKEYIPYSTHGEIFIDGEKVVMSFDPKNTNLNSLAVADAIREIALKQTQATAGVSDIKYSSETRTITMTKDGGDVDVEEKLTDLASQEKHDNTFKTKSGFTNGYIKGKGTDYTSINPNANQTIQQYFGGNNANNTKCWWTTSAVKIEPNTPVTTLRIAVGGTAQENDVISDILIRAAEITQTGGADQNRFTAREDLFTGKAIVKRINDADLGNRLYVEVPINKRFDREIVLMIQVPYSLVGVNAGANNIGLTGLSEMHSTGVDFVVAGNTQPYGIMRVVSQDVPFEQLINKEMPILIEDVHNLQKELDDKISWSKAVVKKSEALEPTVNNYVVKLNEEGMIDDSLIDFPDGNTRYELDSFSQDEWVGTNNTFYVGDILYVKNEDKYYHCIKDTTDQISEGFIPIGVGKWEDLKDVTKQNIENANLVAYETKVTGKRYDGGKGNASVVNDREASYVCIDVEQGSAYTIFKKINDNNNRFYFLSEDNTAVDAANYGDNFTQEQNWQKLVIPANVFNAQLNGKTIKKLAIPFKHGQNASNELMAFKGTKVLDSEDFIPYVGKDIMIDSSKVALSYSSDREDLKSKTVNDAIDEIADRLANNQNNLENYVHKVKENTVYGKTVLHNGIIAGSTQINKVHNTAKTGMISNDNAYFTCDDMKITGSTGSPVRLSHIVVGVDDNLQVGETVTGVNIGLATREGNRLRVKKYIHKNAKAVVHDNKEEAINSCAKAVTIDVNESITEEVYVMVGVNGAYWSASNGVGGATAGGSIKEPNELLDSNLNNTNFNGKVVFYSNETPLINLVKTISLSDDSSKLEVFTVKGDKKEINLPNNGGTVQTVNGIAPQGDGSGNVVLTATPSFEQNNLKIKTGQVEFTSIPCYEQTDSTALLAEIDTL